ncbi:MAG: AMP-binding protein, partial [Gammaproteobacteria bacterium]
MPARYNIAHEVCDKHTGLTDATALYCDNVAAERSTFTFGQLTSLSNAFANVLRGLGVERGDRVAIVLSQRAETAIAHLAAYKLGAVALPMSILFGPDALEYRLRDSETRLAITDSAHLAVIAELRAELPELQALIGCDDAPHGNGFWQLLDKASDRFEPVPTAADDPALLIYT